MINCAVIWVLITCIKGVPLYYYKLSTLLIRTNGLEEIVIPITYFCDSKSADDLIRKIITSGSCISSWAFFRPPGIGYTNTNSLRSLTCLLTSTEIRTVSLHQPVIYTALSQVVIIMQIHSIAKVGREWSCEDEELKIISKKAFCLNPATSTWDALRRLGDKQAMKTHKGKEKKDNKRFHLNPHRDKSKEYSAVVLLNVAGRQLWN